MTASTITMWDAPGGDGGGGHESVGGFCLVWGAELPCVAARRAGVRDDSAPCRARLSPMIGGAGGGSDDERRRSRHPTVGRRARATARRAGRPVALGYVRLRPGEGAVSVAAGIAGLEAFADSRGWELGEVFVDDDPARPLLAWANLAAAAWGLRLAAVLVPDVPGLRPSSLVLERLRIRCARETGASLLLAPPVLTPEPSPGPMAGRADGLPPQSADTASSVSSRARWAW